jgi:outer membrane protein OmpA-like peptidoglycan-associated protein
MSSQDEQQENRVAAVVLIAAVLMAVGLAIGVAIQKVRGSGAKAAPAAVAAGDASAGTANGAAASAPAAAAPEAAAPAAASDDASVVVENGVVKFYFASGKSDLAPGAVEALADAIAAGKAGQKLVISGFHDSTGDPAKNAELAKQRALAVRDALKAAGVADSGIELKKPETATGSGNNAEARRVEVMIAS